MKATDIVPGLTYMVRDYGPAKVLFVHEKDVTIEVERTVKEVYRQVCVSFVQAMPEPEANNQKGVNDDRVRVES